MTITLINPLPGAAVRTAPATPDLAQRDTGGGGGCHWPPMTRVHCGTPPTIIPTCRQVLTLPAGGLLLKVPTSAHSHRALLGPQRAASNGGWVSGKLRLDDATARLRTSLEPWAVTNTHAAPPSSNANGAAVVHLASNGFGTGKPHPDLTDWFIPTSSPIRVPLQTLDAPLKSSRTLRSLEADAADADAPPAGT
ncbi:FAD assembly factor SdhE [Frankliniella fusca]|uniref:FAD assembly factor SdhE n=1 Tax=Frankliniella fusca TaxID=407009 RepID=A0AAE1HP96_9NEOP|nr:FAD assembly factor SdhE [Frankliniella fusca]